MKRLAYICLFLVLTPGLFGQMQDPKFAQNMFMTPFFNPGAVGSSDKICLLAAFRNQWTSLPAAPTSTTFTAHMPFELLGRSHGVGINLYNDNLAFQNDFIFDVSYAYHMNLASGKLGIGLNVGVANQSLEPDWQNADGAVSPDGDPLIPGTGGSLFGFDMGLGLYYYTDDFYVGLSTTHLNEATFTYPTQGEEVSMTRFFYMMAGYNIQLSNPMFEVQPSAMIQTDGRLHHIYLNSNVRYNKKFWGGVTYEVGGGFDLLVGIEMLNGLRIGYSYGVELSPVMSYSTGSHEVTVRYCFDLSVDKSPSKYKSIRFL